MAENMKRVTAKVFAGNGDSSVIGQFGSALIGTKVNTTDVETIQALPAYTIGWSSAVITNRNYPTLEEMNGVMKTMSYQTAYNMQKGVAEWDEKTTYYKGDICKGVGEGILYYSRVEENVGNPVTRTDYWAEYTGSATTIPATNYVISMQGEASYSDNILNLPAIAGYAPNGRNLDGSIKSLSVAVSGDFTLTGSGRYDVFFNNDTKNLVLANEYFKYVSDTPETKVTNNVWWDSETNETKYVSSVLPNYVTSDNVNVTEEGIVSNLGILTASANWNVGATPVMDMEFATGSDVTSEQALFSIPFAEASIKDGSLNVDLYSTAYAVTYGEQIYNGTYSLTNEDTSYKYDLNGVVVYSANTIAVDTILYTNKDKTAVYGTVTAVTDNTCTVTNNDDQIYSGVYTLDDILKVYTYSLGANTYYAEHEIAQNTVLYTDDELNNVWGTVSNITANNVTVIGGVNVGYVSQQGTGTLPNGVIIYSDINCTTQIEVSTGANATYLGELSRSKISTITKTVVADTTYTGTISFANDTYNITLNNQGSNFISSRLPYSYSGSISLGGNKGFKGTFNLKKTFVTGTWIWNNKIDGAVAWTVAPLLHLGEVEMLNNAITSIHIHKPIVLAQMSDLENSANVELSNTQRLSNCILSYANPITYVNNVTSAVFTLPAGYKVIFGNGRNSTNNTVESVEKTTQEDLSITIQNNGTAVGITNVIYLQYLNNVLSLTYGRKDLQIISDTQPETADTQVYFWLNQAENNGYTGNSTNGWTRTYLVPIAEYISTDTNIINNIYILPPLDIHSTYINRLGDTTTGLITFKTPNYEKINVQSNNGILASTIPATEYDNIQFSDKYGRRAGTLETIFGADGSRFINMNMKKSPTDTTYMRLGVGFDKDGNSYTEAPTPATADRSTKIATTAFVGNVFNSALSATVSKSGNGYIRFSNGIIIQWGYTSFTTDYTTLVNFPIAFTSTYSIACMSNVDDDFPYNNLGLGCLVQHRSATNVLIRTMQQSAPSIQWVAVGF